MIVCLVFVFASLIEYAVVNVLARRTGKFADAAAADDDAEKRAPRSRAVRAPRSPADRQQSTLVPQVYTLYYSLVYRSSRNLPFLTL